MIRRASLDDAGAILNVLRAAFAPYQSRYTTEAFDDTVLTPMTLERRMKTMTIFVAIDEDEVAGTIACGASGDEGHLRGMAVLPARLGKGIAPALLQAAEAELRARNCKRVTLDTTEPLQRARAFYEKHGYRKSGRVTDFFGMPLYEYVKAL